MKRVPIKRKKPLTAKTRISQKGKGLKQTTPLARGKKLPKRNAKRKPAAADWEIAHLGAVKQLPCVICGRYGPSQAHHVFHSRATLYGGQKAAHTAAIPLCADHHTDGPDAVHRIKTTWRERWGPDWSYIPGVMKAIYGKEEMTDEEIKQYWDDLQYAYCI